MKKVNILISNMRCGACKANVEKIILKNKGVESVNINLLSGLCELTYNEALLDIDEVISDINGAGFEAVTDFDENSLFKKDNFYSLKEFITLLLFSVPLSYISLSNMIFEEPFIFDFLNMHTNLLGYTIGLFVLSIFIFVLGLKFFIPGIKNLIKLRPNMDTLITLSSLSTYILSLVFSILIFIDPTSSSNNHYGMFLLYDVSAMVLSFVYGGKLLEQHYKNKAKTSMKDMLSLAPKNAFKVDESNHEEEVCINTLSIGDIIHVYQDTRIPADGICIKNSCHVDKSSITGESNPIFIKKDDEVLGGSMLIDGDIYIKITKAANNTLLNNILKLVSKSQSKKSKTDNIIDTISLYFVPTIILLSIITFLSWYFTSYDLLLSIKYFSSILVVACPCAIGLAIPLANTFTSMRAIKSGFVIKNSAILETIRNIDIAIFDKTGTLTLNELEVSEFLIYSENKNFIKSLIYSAEKSNVHPIATSISNYLKDSKPLNKDDIKLTNIIGKGIEIQYKNELYYLGSKNFIESKLNIESIKEPKDTTIYLSSRNKIEAKISLKYKLRPQTKELIAYLKSKKITPVMLTGDAYGPANAIASELGIEDFLSDLLPEDKYDCIQDYKNENKKILYVGDGINDAPSLALSDIAVTPYMGSDIATSNSDVYLTNESFDSLIKFIKLGRYSYKIIILNIMWAFIYNIIGLFLASGMFFASSGVALEPYMSALMMTFSSFSVIISSLTIKLKRL